MQRSDRMKSYEDRWRQSISAKQYTILRVDGRAFHTLTRDMTKPFDPYFMQAMDIAAVALCEQVQGCQFAYIQSDEISLLLADFGPMAQPWFGGVIPKMCSISACIASNAFNFSGISLPKRLAQFDARVFTVPDRGEAVNYFLWRQADCHRNAVSMAAQAHFSSKQLKNKNIGQRIEMLASIGVDFQEHFPAAAHLGRVVTKVPQEAEVTYVRKDTGQEYSQQVTRYRWQVAAADWFDWDEAGFLEQHVPHGERGE